jgi:hypothetical protein
MEKIMVYIAGPMTKGDMKENVATAMDVATNLLTEGFHVILPHLNMFLEQFWADTDTAPDKWGTEQWLEWDYHMLSLCDVVLRIEGESPGSDRETAFARGRRIPVVHAVNELIRYRQKVEGASK